MNRWLAAAAFLSALTAGIHILLGGAEIPPHFTASDMPKDMQSLALILWHFASAVLLIGTATLGIASRSAANMRGALWVIAAEYTAIMLLFIAYTLSWFGSLMVLPQWIAFALILLCMVMGMRKGAATPSAR